MIYNIRSLIIQKGNRSCLLKNYWRLDNATLIYTDSNRQWQTWGWVVFLDMDLFLEAAIVGGVDDMLVAPPLSRPASLRNPCIYNHRNRDWLQHCIYFIDFLLKDK